VKRKRGGVPEVGHLEGGAERPQVVGGAQSGLEAVQDEEDGDVSAGVMAAAQLLRDGLDLRRDVLVWVHQQHRSNDTHTHTHTET